jgi:Peptidase M10 serralysin C terminal/Matrixin
MFNDVSGSGDDPSLLADETTPIIVSVSKPTFTLPQIVTQLTTSWGGGDTRTRTWGGSSVTFSIPNAVPTNAAGTPSEAAGLVAMTAHEIADAQLAFRLWDDLIPVSLVQSASASANITFDYSTTTSGDGTYTKPFLAGNTATNNRILAQQVWIDANATWPTNQDKAILPESYGNVSYIHEIGHALGLSHPGAYNAGGGGAITYAGDAVYAQDNRQYSLMSYFGGYDLASNSWTQDGTVANWLYPDTPMVDDIAAIQALYGADTTTRTGNDVYGFDCSLSAGDAEKAIYDFNLNPHPIFTIWDAGGNDTLDCSGYSGNQTINLTPGSYSSVDGMVQNVAIAYNCIIENAIGGAGNDTLISGHAGDELTGGGGSNLFEGSAANLNGDNITDFSAIDKLDLTDTPYLGPGLTLVQFDGGGQLLTVSDANGGNAYARIQVEGVPGGDKFVAASDGNGGTLLTLAPGAPPVAAIDPGVAFNNARLVTLTGTASGPAASPIAVEVWDNGVALGAAQVDGNGTWTLSNVYLAFGDHNLAVSASDAYGNTSTPAAADFFLQTGITHAPYRSYEEDFDASGNYSGEVFTKANGETYLADYLARNDANGDHRLNYYAGAYFDNLDYYYKSDLYSSDYGVLKTETLYNNDGTHAITGFVAGQHLHSVHDDTFTGGGPRETFVFGPHFGKDVIADFRARGAGHDVLSLSTKDFSSFAQVMAHTTTSAGAAFIHVGLHDTITLAGVTRAQLIGHATDFSFHA